MNGGIRMIKEELEKEAIKCMHEIKYWLKVPIKKETEKDGINEILKLTEPREKQIEELEEQNTNLQQAIKWANERGNEHARQIADLEVENAELKNELKKWKDEWQEQVQKATDEGYARTLQTIQLTKVKEILAKLLEEEKNNMYWEMNGSDKSSYYEVRKQAEQFLKDSEVE